jgi:hypothetical protein
MLLKREVEKILSRPDSTLGAEHNYWCPWCREKGARSHLHVNYLKGFALCHECGAKSKSIAGLLRRLGGAVPRSLVISNAEGQEFDDEVEATLYGTDVAEVDERKAVQFPQHFRPFAKASKNPGRRAALRYLRNRGVTREQLVAIGAGYVWWGKMEGYAILPVVVNGEMTMWTSRAVPGLVGKKAPKVLHSTGGRARVSIFNYDACKRATRLFICEGPFDAWWMHARLAPGDGGLCLFGVNVSREKLELLAALPAKEVVVMLDGDRAGRNAEVEVAARIAGATGKIVRIAKLPDEKDPDELDDRTLRRCVRRAAVYDEMYEVEALLA